MALPPLYPHQVRAISQVRDEYRKGARAICLVLPCGAGKTRTATEICAGALRKGNRMGWFVHRDELLMQGLASLEELGSRCGVIRAGKRSTDPEAPIQIASVQTLHSQPDLLPDVDVAVSDECHHDKAQTRQAMLARFPSLKLLLGLTATPMRGDGKPLGVKSGGVYEALVVGATVAELQRTLRPDGHPILVPFRVFGPAQPMKELFRAPVEGYLEFGRRADGSFRPGLLFAASLDESREIAALALRHGIRAAHVDGETDELERAQTFAALREGRLDLVSNVLVATEGTDLPNVEVVGIARGCSAASTWIQMVMRAGRSCPATGKRDAVLIDYRGFTHVHGRMEEDRSFSLDGRAIELKQKLALRQCASCGCVFEPAPKCPSCGAVPPAMKRARAAVMRTDAIEITSRSTASMAEKWNAFRSLQAEARAKGWKPAAIGMRFKQRFGHWPVWPLGGKAA